MKIKISKSQWEEMGKKSGWMKTAQGRMNRNEEEMYPTTGKPSKPYTNEEVKAKYDALTKAIKEDPDALFSDPETVYIIEYTEDTSKLPYYDQLGVDKKNGDQDLANKSSYYTRKVSNHKFKIIGKTTFQEIREMLKQNKK